VIAEERGEERVIRMICSLHLMPLDTPIQGSKAALGRRSIERRECYSRVFLLAPDHPNDNSPSAALPSHQLTLPLCFTLIVQSSNPLPSFSPLPSHRLQVTVKVCNESSIEEKVDQKSLSSLPPFTPSHLFPTNTSFSLLLNLSLSSSRKRERERHRDRERHRERERETETKRDRDIEREHQSLMNPVE
jgi:hypothetical protein